MVVGMSAAGRLPLRTAPLMHIVYGSIRVRVRVRQLASIDQHTGRQIARNVGRSVSGG